MKNTMNTMNAKMEKVVTAYQDRYPTLFALVREEAKDAVKFVFRAAK